MGIFGDVKFWHFELGVQLLNLTLLFGVVGFSQSRNLLIVLGFLWIVDGKYSHKHISRIVEFSNLVTHVFEVICAAHCITLVNNMAVTH